MIKGKNQFKCKVKIASCTEENFQPINLIDPTGMAAEHIDVTKNEDGYIKS